MSFARPLILTLITSAAIAAPGLSRGSTYYLDGNDLIEHAADDDRAKSGAARVEDYHGAARLIGYVLGVVDSLDGNAFCIPDNVLAKQHTAIVKKYLQENPDQWNQPARRLIVSALASPFPCPN